MGSAEDRDATIHVEFEAAVWIHLVLDQRGDGELVAWRESVEPVGSGENLLQHESIDEDGMALSATAVISQ
jgi:hypothetical protein